MDDNTKKYIRENYEWSMGCGGQVNEGQCPICCGCSEKHALKSAGYIGHNRNCNLAKALDMDGEIVIWKK